MAVRVVFDTNVSISALLSRGSAYRAVLLAKSGVVQAVYCDPMLAELTQKLREKFEFDESHVRAVVHQVRQYAQRVEIPRSLRLVHEDPDDDVFVECALVSGARYLVSDDRHLLKIGAYHGIDICTPPVFLAELTGRPLA